MLKICLIWEIETKNHIMPPVERLVTLGMLISRIFNITSITNRVYPLPLVKTKSQVVYKSWNFIMSSIIHFKMPSEKLLNLVIICGTI